ncbi:hypothetical protein JG688_00016644, partial [Phytophthora aleatoria]
LLSVEINAWKLSDKVEYTQFNNPRMPSVDTVCEWVRKAWRDTDEATKFNALWGSDDENLDEDTLNMQALDDAFDDIAVVDE